PTMPIQPLSEVLPLAITTLPFVLAGNGSIGLQGALTLNTGIALAYPDAFMYFPAGAVYTSSPAGWYFTQFSSVTTGTVYNYMYVSGQAHSLKSPESFYARTLTGAAPGAYTQTTGSPIVAVN